MREWLLQSGDFALGGGDLESDKDGWPKDRECQNSSSVKKLWILSKTLTVRAETALFALGFL